MAIKTILKDKPKKLIKKYCQVLVNAGIPVKKIILFGSYVKGTQKPWSDLDLCIVSDIFGKDPLKEMMLLKKLTTKVETMIEPYPYNPQDLAEPWDSLANEIRKHGQRII